MSDQTLSLTEWLRLGRLFFPEEVMADLRARGARILESQLKELRATQDPSPAPSLPPADGARTGARRSRTSDVMPRESRPARATRESAAPKASRAPKASKADGAKRASDRSGGSTLWALVRRIVSEYPGSNSGQILARVRESMPDVIEPNFHSSLSKMAGNQLIRKGARGAYTFFPRDEATSSD